MGLTSGEVFNNSSAQQIFFAYTEAGSQETAAIVPVAVNLKTELIKDALFTFTASGSEITVNKDCVLLVKAGMVWSRGGNPKMTVREIPVLVLQRLISATWTSYNYTTSLGYQRSDVYDGCHAKLTAVVNATSGLKFRIASHGLIRIGVPDPTVKFEHARVFMELIRLV